MAVRSSGQLSMLNDIVAEFGGTAPHKMSEYYGGAGLVPAGANPSVPTSNQIRLGNMYSSVAATVLNITSNVNNYDIGAAAIAAGGDKNTPVILTINSGVTVGSTSSSTPAMYTGTGWGAGVTINITNNGSIVGASGSNNNGAGGSGGSGGTGGIYNNANGTPGGSGSAGSGSADSTNNGGNAFEHSQTSDNNLSVIFDTAGTRTGGSAGTKTFLGGGGGGGGGGRGLYNSCCYSPAGGGGGGAANGSGGSGGNQGGISAAPCNYGGNGSSGGSTTGGSGGSGVCNAGNGGNGGDLGNSGSSGTSGVSSGSSGGSAGSTGNASGSAGSALAGNTGQIS